MPYDEEPGNLETDAILVRTLSEDDLAAVVAIDAQASGRRRPRYFELMFQRSMAQSDLEISLVAELDGQVAGFLIATLFYGEYGVVEPSASIDAIGVESARRGRHVGAALMRQLRMNLGALQIPTLRTEVDWDNFEMLGFFRNQGFVPAGRLCLESPIDPTAPGD